MLIVVQVTGGTDGEQALPPGLRDAFRGAPAADAGYSVVEIPVDRFVPREQISFGEGNGVLGL